MNINFIFTTNAHPNYAPLQLHDMEVDWRYPEMGYARNNEGYFLQDILPNFANMIERQTYTIVSASESILRRLQRYIVEDSGLSFIRFYQEATIRVFWYDVARGILTDAEIDQHGQVHHMPHNFFDTISDDLAAYCDAALAIRHQELEELEPDWDKGYRAYEEGLMLPDVGVSAEWEQGWLDAEYLFHYNPYEDNSDERD